MKKMKRFVQTIDWYFIQFTNQNYVDIQDFVDYMNREYDAKLYMSKDSNVIGNDMEMFYLIEGHCYYFADTEYKDFGYAETIEEIYEDIKARNMKEYIQKVSRGVDNNG